MLCPFRNNFSFNQADTALGRNCRLRCKAVYNLKNEYENQVKANKLSKRFRNFVAVKSKNGMTKTWPSMFGANYT